MSQHSHMPRSGLTLTLDIFPTGLRRYTDHAKYTACTEYTDCTKYTTCAKCCQCSPLLRSLELLH
ncbi:hypothetical protein BU25DRAFT_412427 [Macroventuria anomochaeta]|uniref:Uncharacterized protein n=1 Tax=Macroventuria anomochaeta TaxID=301207 RepID=A0ACB6RWI7_9PLEO|nr:uncharacterized protein BU25DRAFT_412427 [Macroventuria anomochaeta]KAF2625780.1 hypothetical protein BU25DRAFT_412427 [Macroventuria anomochaeta]